MPSKSKAQQALMGMALAVRQGKLKRSQVDKEVLDIADGDMSTKDLEHFAKTKRKSLPDYIKEAMDLGSVDFKVTYKVGDEEFTDYFSASYYNELKERLEVEHPDWEIVKIGL